MILSKEQIIPAIMTNSWKRLLFTNGSALALEKHEDTNSSLVLIDRYYQEIARGNTDTIYHHITILTPCCSFCSNLNDIAATEALIDGFLVCNECKSKVEKYYCCYICKTPLNKYAAEKARCQLAVSICNNNECQKKYDVERGRLCCMLATYVPCVCFYSYKCPVHAPQGVHVGTHD